MVKRTPPLTLGFIGQGESSPKNVEALLNDFTSPYAEVTFILPVDDAHWTPTLDTVAAWATTNDIPYVAVTDGSSPSKALVSLLEGADSTIKVAKVGIKMVQLLQQEAGEGADVAAMIAWEDDDNEAVTTVNKALGASVRALNLCDGLDEFEFDDDEAPADEEGEVAQAPRGSAGGAAGVSQPEPDDDYESKGIRALRGLLREREGHGLTDRSIGQLEKDEAIAALRKLDGKAGAQEPAEEPDEAQTETSTTRARRAFAEGASEGQDEARPLPRSKGSDILEDENDEVTETKQMAVASQSRENTEATTTVAPNEDGLRHRALELAITSGAKGTDAIADAMKYEVYLKGERQSGGRPRADGTPAQPREIDEDGKPVRRRASRSTE